MVYIQDKSKCSGCKACANICPTNAIGFKYDDEGCWYPDVDIDKCINCEKCRKACPFLSPNHGVTSRNLEHSTVFYAAQLKNTEELALVSSGGAFQALAMTVIDNGGVVYGAAQIGVDSIIHIRATNGDELMKTRRSKYFQSDIKDCYSRAKVDLTEGRVVLFSGTGCQIAGLNCFLGKEYENLFTCEVVCHGVPAKKIWEAYKREKEQEQNKRITGLIFRDKSMGWSNNQYKISYEDGTCEYEKSTIQLFHAGYLQGLFYRPSCGTCPFASMPRVADITLADYWRYKGLLNKNNLGVSLVAVNNVHGQNLLDLANKYLSIETTSRKTALESCRHMDEHPIENPKRKEFIQHTFSYGYFSAAREFLDLRCPTFSQKIKNKIRSWLRR